MLKKFTDGIDYQAAISMDPNVEIDYVRAASKPENRQFYKEIFGKELPAW